MRLEEAFINSFHHRSSRSHNFVGVRPYYSTARNYAIASNRNMREVTMYSSPTQISDGVLSSEDIIIGAVLALSLAFLFSFLQGRSPSSSNIILWRNQNQQEDETIEETTGFENEKIFNGESWKEISRPENYAVYSKGKVSDNSEANVNQFGNLEDLSFIPQKESLKSGKIENRLVLISLLILFVPIFSVEFFFALSRQFICGDYITSVDDSLWIMDAKKAASASSGSSPWAAQLCSPANMSK